MLYVTYYERCQYDGLIYKLVGVWFERLFRFIRLPLTHLLKLFGPSIRPYVCPMCRCRKLGQMLNIFLSSLIPKKRKKKCWVIEVFLHVEQSECPNYKKTYTCFCVYLSNNSETLLLPWTLFILQ